MKERRQSRTGSGLRSGSAEVLGIDAATTGVKAVRMRSTRDGLALVGCVELPAILLNGARPEGEPVKLALPKDFRGRNAGLALTSKRCVVRLLNLQGGARQPHQMEQVLRSQTGLDADFRLGYSVLSTARANQETTVLAVGIPEGEARSLLDVVADQSIGTVALEVSSLAAASAFARSKLAETSDGAVGLIDAGAVASCLTVFYKGQPVLLRKFDFGSRDTELRVQRQFGVDDSTARSIIADAAFDISQAVQEAMGPFVRQLAISREFVERKAGVPIKTWYLSGGITLANYWGQRIRAAVGADVRVWNPLEGIELLPGAWPDALKGQESRFAAAIGSAAGVLQEL